MPPAPLPPAVRAALVRVAALVALTADGVHVADRPVADGAAGLAEALYACWYTVDPAPPRPDGVTVSRTSLLPALRAAHVGAGVGQDLWTVVEATPAGVLTATAGGLTRVLRPGEYVAWARPGAPVAPGEAVRAVGRLDSLDSARGLWWTMTAVEPALPLGRVYLHLRAATAASVVHEVTAALEGTAAYQLKCPVEPAACGRVDAMVLYHARALRPDVLSALGRRADRLRPLLDPAVPPLTCAVAPGTAWADEQGDGQQSFGQTRCQALAVAVLAAGAGWTRCSSDARVGLLVDGLATAGIDPTRPWLDRA